MIFKKQKPVETKRFGNSFVITNQLRQLPLPNFNDLTAFYKKCSVVSSCIDLIADALVSVDIGVRKSDKNLNDEDSWLPEHPILQLIENPNLFENDLIRLIAYSYLIYGNCFLNVTYNSKLQPISVEILQPSLITIYQSNEDLHPARYDYNASTMSISYSRTKTGEFWSKDAYNQILHLANYSPDKTQGFFGVSKLQQCHYEILQAIMINETNLSVLNEGVKPSMLISPKDMESSNLVDQDLYDTIKQQMADLKGVGGAGKSLFTTVPLNIAQMSLNPKDMDFRELLRSATQNIAKCLKVPLPLIASEVMTYSNFGEAKLQLYDNAVMPLLQTILNFLTTRLLHKYNNSEELYLDFDPESVSVIAERNINKLKTLYESNLVSLNEMRSRINYPEVEGGDTIYRSNSVTPVSSSVSEEDQMLQDYNDMVDSI